MPLLAGVAGVADAEGLVAATAGSSPPLKLRRSVTVKPPDFESPLAMREGYARPGSDSMPPGIPWLRV